jgi:hypothetical protein
MLPAVPLTQGMRPTFLSLDQPSWNQATIEYSVCSAWVERTKHPPPASVSRHSLYCVWLV